MVVDIDAQEVADVGRGHWTQRWWRTCTLDRNEGGDITHRSGSVHMVDTPAAFAVNCVGECRHIIGGGVKMGMLRVVIRVSAVMVAVSVEVLKALELEPRCVPPALPSHPRKMQVAAR